MNNSGHEAMRSHYRWRLAQAAEIRWWRLYLRRRDKASYLSAKRRYWKTVLERAGFFPAAGETVLDAGCGPAGIFLILQEQCVDAVDPLIAQYERRLPHFSAADYPWVTFYPTPIETFRPRGAYQTIFCLNAINHVADLEAALDRLLKCLAPGGRLLLSVDAHRFDLLKVLFRALPGDILHPHQHALADYRRFIELRGCRMAKVVKLKSGRIFDYYLMHIEKF